MKKSTLDMLVCPSCHGLMTPRVSAGNGRIQSGSLACPACNKTYPILRGITHFIQSGELVGLNKPFARMYDWFSWIYSAFSRVGFLLLGTTESRARQELMDRLQPVGKVLEVSIGPGVNLPFLIHTPGVDEIFGLDISTGQLNRCNALIQRKGWSVDLFLANGEELPFADNSFDSVFHVGGINFFSNKGKAIAEMIRVAKPGTRIVICDENEAGAQWYEKFLPGFKGAFHGQREQIIAPVDLVPGTMLDFKQDDIWKGFMYYLEFRKPY